MPWITVAKSVFRSPKVLGMVGIIAVLGIGAWYIDYRKDKYEQEIAELAQEVKDKNIYIERQQSEFDKYRVSVSTSLIEQALRLSESRREAQKRIQSLEGQIDDIRSKTPEIYSEDGCEASEMLIDDMLGLE